MQRQQFFGWFVALGIVSGPGLMGAGCQADEAPRGTHIGDGSSDAEVRGAPNDEGPGLAPAEESPNFSRIEAGSIAVEYSAPSGWIPIEEVAMDDARSRELWRSQDGDAASTLAASVQGNATGVTAEEWFYRLVPGVSPGEPLAGDGQVHAVQVASSDDAVQGHFEGPGGDLTLAIIVATDLWVARFVLNGAPDDLPDLEAYADDLRSDVLVVDAGGDL